MGSEHLAEFKRRGHIRKIAQQMDFLTGCDFHAREQQQAVCIAHFLRCREIACSIVIGDRNDIQAFDFGHAADIARRHLVIPARGEAAVNMQVGKEFHSIFSPDYTDYSAGTPFSCIRPQIS